MRIEKEIDKRQQIESEGHSVNTETNLVFISHNLIHPNPEKRGESKRLSFFLPRHKEQSNYLLDTQNIK